MTPNPELVQELADQVEQMPVGEVFSLTWRAGDTPEQRRLVLDHHAAILEELRRRGHDPRATVVRDEVDVEHYVVALPPPS